MKSETIPTGQVLLSRPHYRLNAWIEAIVLTKLIYQISRKFPQSEQYGLTSQMRRASVSVASNIAEGAARTSKREFAQFLSIAQGSLSEVETQIIIAAELGYLSDKLPVLQKIDLVARLVGGLRRKLVV